VSTRPDPHVLVVDDEADVRDLVTEYLARNDIRVSAVTCGRDMFEVFDRESIDLVLLDLTLPGEDGMELARSLRERATVPIVLLTGRDEEADRVMGLELGADDYVTKPSARANCWRVFVPCSGATRSRQRCLNATTRVGPFAFPDGS
jgi:DNA-binding response OmpR family regulator